MIQCKTCHHVSAGSNEDIRVAGACPGCGDTKFAVDIEHYLDGESVFSTVPSAREPQQQALAALVEHDDPYTPLLLEAEVGTGKTLAYLVAGVFHHGSVLVATSSKNLQSQIAHKEMPRIAASYRLTHGKELTWTVLQGKNNYVCKLQVPEKVSVKDRKAKRELDNWIINEDTAFDAGSKTTHMIETLPEEVRIAFGKQIRLDKCSGATCPYADSCGYWAAKRAITDKANVVITNHSLLVAWYKGAKMQAAMPSELRRLNVIDEAHEFADNARSGLSTEVSFAAAQKELLSIITIMISLMDTQHHMTFSMDFTPYEAAMDNMVLIAQRVRRDPLVLDDLVDAAELRQTIMEAGLKLNSLYSIMREWLQMCSMKRSQVEEEDPMDDASLDDADDQQHGAALRLAFNELINTLKYSANTNATHIITLEARGQDTVIVATPASLVIGGLKLQSLEPLPDETKPLFVLTSGTLIGCGDNKIAHLEYDYGTMLSGDGGPKIVEIKSPFDYRAQSACFYPNSPKLNPKLPPSAYYPALCACVEDLLEITNGFALVLVTSYTAMNELKAGVVWPGQLICQSDYHNASEATAAYLHAADMAMDVPGSPGPVLVGAQSFWRGVSIEGPRLVQVIIPKMDFQVPTDPLVKLRGASDDNYFMNGSVQYAYTQMAQGVGRLIRTVKDYGIISILDPRLRGSKWGLLIWKRLVCSSRYTDNIDLIKQAFQKMKEKYGDG